jgi:hypothetical protein
MLFNIGLRRKVVTVERAEIAIEADSLADAQRLAPQLSKTARPTWREESTIEADLTIEKIDPLALGTEDV